MAVKGVQPIELMQLCESLHENFEGYITGQGNDQQRESSFCTQALAAWFLVHEAGASIDEAVAASIDGNNDNGIDAVFVDSTDTIWLIQSKYIGSGKGEPDLGEIHKFGNGVRDLLGCRWERFNQALNEKRARIESALNSGVAKCRFVFLHTGDALSDDRRRLMADVEREFESPGATGFARFSGVGLSTLHQILIDQVSPSAIDVTIELENYGYLEKPRPSIYGSMKADQLAKLCLEHGQHLFNANIRQFKGDTQVNKDIEQTLKQSPDSFFYYNNGVTLLCDDFQDVGPRDSTRLRGKFNLQGVSVINGAQTVNCIANTSALVPSDNDSADKIKVLTTIISINGAPAGFADAVTRNRNSQNLVSDVDFAALDENQKQWALTLASSGVVYRYKGGQQEGDL